MPTTIKDRNEILDDILDSITHVAFFTNYIPTQNDTMVTRHELARVVPVKSRVNNLARWEFVIPVGLVDCPSTTVVSATTTTLVLTDGSLFSTSDERVRISLPTSEQRDIIAKDGANTIIINPALPVAPGAGIVVDVLLSEVALVRNGLSGANTGTIFHIRPWKIFRNTTSPEEKAFFEFPLVSV